MGYKMKNNETNDFEHKKFGVIFFEDFKQAKLKSDQLKSYSALCKQLNVVIEQEGDMDDVSLLSISTNIKIYAGEAWTVIHKRRREEGWYSDKFFFNE